MRFEEVKLAPGERLITEDGRPLDAHPYAYWPDYFVVNRAGDILTRHDYHLLPPDEREHWYKIRYAVVVNGRGDTIRREYRDGAHDFWSADTHGREINRQAPETWPDFIGVHLENEEEITATEYWELPADQRKNYRIVRFCIVRDSFGPVERIYADQELQTPKPDPVSSPDIDLGSLPKPYYEPSLVSTSSMDGAAASDSGQGTKRRYDTTLADQIRPECKLQVGVSIYKVE